MNHVSVLTEEFSNDFLNHLINNVQWTEGITTRDGKITRFQKHLEMCDEHIKDVTLQVIKTCFERNGIDLENISCYGLYMNYYRDGNDYCPKHRHLGTKQMILSLGAVRKLGININGNDTYINMENGSALFFGEEYHWMYSDRNNVGPRISIVVFYR